MKIAPGATLHIPDTGPAQDRDRPHLFVVLTLPCEQGMVLLVPICRIKNKYDPACKLVKGDHGFIQVDSYIAYFHAQQYKAEILEKQEAKGHIKADDPVKASILEKIKDGISKSREIAPSERRYFNERILVEAAVPVK